MQSSPSKAFKSHSARVDVRPTPSTAPASQVVPTWRELVLLGVGKREAAQVMGCSPSTAAQRLQRATERLLTELDAVDTASPGWEAIALFLQSNFPVEFRRKARLDRVVVVASCA